MAPYHIRPGYIILAPSDEIIALPRGPSDSLHEMIFTWFFGVSPAEMERRDINFVASGFSYQAMDLKNPTKYFCDFKFTSGTFNAGRQSCKIVCLIFRQIFVTFLTDFRHIFQHIFNFEKCDKNMTKNVTQYMVTCLVIFLSHFSTQFFDIFSSYFSTHCSTIYLSNVLTSFSTHFSAHVS